ncbi:hypothetical protein NTE_01514 [Candidatus Nitrososphaera evergladensis SR1]|uniref:Uncharacterized protein n=1 Tax=Candidatus Nitrososphaera evergladensis SR1 TaxID=1459636 RepID=A0A075MRY3_9ARCH|nr:hypothetical protein [Candidatus Nitrososphaera evergladensis]AIF83577.1 hypothetical protein NTE_01514 [Candidatus Nitrososphaera evergladensis SR1]
MIYRCSDGHISFAKEPLLHCGMKGCENSADAVSTVDIEWFYRISPSGLAINEQDLHMILKDRNMPQDVKDRVREIFPAVPEKKKRFFGLR